MSTLGRPVSVSDKWKKISHFSTRNRELIAANYSMASNLFSSQTPRPVIVKHRVHGAFKGVGVHVNGLVIWWPK